MIFHLTRHKKPINEIECFIYCIKDPKTKRIVYIGNTSNFKMRRSYHLSVKWESNKKCKWIRKMITQKLIPLFEIICTVENRNEAKNVEKFFIDCYEPPLNSEK